MPDILCRVCGEPWDNYYVYQEMDQDDGLGSHTKFLSGHGCPSCRWGTYCHHCNGTGKATTSHAVRGVGLIYDYDDSKPCRWCKGDPKHPQLPDDQWDEALSSLVDGTDEDPTIYLGV